MSRVRTTNHRLLLAFTAAWMVGSPPKPLRADDAVPPRLPRLYLIGDSTVKNGTKGQRGWGDPFADAFDPKKIQVENRARGGRSSRTFLTEGLWDRVAAELAPGDFVLIQFGHNDGGPIVGDRARASLKGNGDESREVTDPATGKVEAVHSYGWYLRKYAADAKAKGATPIVISPVPRNIWKEGRRVARASGDYGKWAAEAAKQGGALLLDLNELVAKRYETLGPDEVKSHYFGTDHTHTTDAGARVTAEIAAEAIRRMEGCPLGEFLRPDSKPEEK